MEMVTWNHDGYYIRHGHDYITIISSNFTDTETLVNVMWWHLHFFKNDCLLERDCIEPT